MKDVGHSLCTSIIQCANKFTAIVMKPKINMYNRSDMVTFIYTQIRSFAFLMYFSVYQLVVIHTKT